MPSGVGHVSLGDMLKLVSLPSESERAANKVSGSRAEELIRIIALVIDDLVGRAAEKRSAEDFAQTRAEVFPQYFAAMRALGDLVRIVVPVHAMERLMSESLSELEADFRDLGPAAFGSDLSDRGLFTIWTLRKIKDLAQEIGTLSPTADHAADVDMAMNFASFAVWTRFHIDCLVRSMRTKKPIYPELVAPIIDGLRGAVDAYAWIRQSIDLRVTIPEPELAPIPWDDEDESLLSDSMRTLSDPC